MPEQNNLGPTSQGTVIADIGGDRGALVLYTPAAMVGAEIEISPVGGGRRTHVAVRERRVGDGRRYAAFYPSLVAGEYTVWVDASRRAGRVTVVAGTVVEVHAEATGHNAHVNSFTVLTAADDG